MDKAEIQTILKQQLTAFATRSYSELVALIDNPITTKITTSSGYSYELEFIVFYDSKPNGNLRITGSIHENKSLLQAIMPLSESLMMRPDGTLV